MSSATFQDVWNAEFAPLIAEKIERAAQIRAEAFVDSTFTLCGEECRLMTPRDLLILDGFDNPFVTASRNIATDADRHFFVWQLSAQNNHTAGLFNRLRCERLARKMMRRDSARDTRDIEAYCSRVFADMKTTETQPIVAGDPSLQRTPSVYFLAPMLVGVASDIGHIDPMSGELLADTPIPRLLQYAQAAIRQRQGEKNSDYDEIARLRSDCLARVNKLNGKN